MNKPLLGLLLGGGLVGAIVGYATQKYREQRAAAL